MSFGGCDDCINRARLLSFYTGCDECLSGCLPDRNSRLLIMLMGDDPDDISLILSAACAFEALLRNTWTASAHPACDPDDSPSGGAILHGQLHVITDLHIWHCLANGRRKNNGVCVIWTEPAAFRDLRRDQHGSRWWNGTETQRTVPLIWIGARHINFAHVLNTRCNHIPSFHAADPGDILNNGLNLAGRCRFIKPYLHVPALLIQNHVWDRLEACHHVQPTDENCTARRQ